MRLLILLISIATFLNIQKSELDARLIGRWMMLYTKDVSGAMVKDEIFGKKYLETYTKDGRLLLDPQFFRDDMKKQGINAPLDYAAIPALGWKTYNN